MARKILLKESGLNDSQPAPIQLLPSLGVNQYYVIEEVIIEYTYVSTQYTFTDSIALKSV